MRRFCAVGLAMMAFTLSRTAGAAPAPPSRIAYTQYTGTIGTLPVEMVLDGEGARAAPGSHYFYTRYQTDIPLEGSLGPAPHLTEPGGGVFDLHLVGAHHQPVSDPAQALGLEGHWTGGGRTLDVTLTSDGGGTYVPGHRYADVTDASDAAFEARVRGFRTAALAGRRAEAARFVSFPLRVTTGPGRFVTVRDAAALEARWEQVFPPAWLAALARSVPHDMFVHNDQAMLGNGFAWFDARGLASVDPVS